VRRVRPFPWQPDIRASDAEREKVVAYLKEHCGEGRLTADELADRTEAAYRAVRLGDLATLTRDLPGSPFAVPARPPARRQRRRASPAATGIVLIALALIVLSAPALPAGAWMLIAGVSAAVLLLGVPLMLIGLAMLAPFAFVAICVIWAIRGLARPPEQRRWGPPPASRWGSSRWNC
jgi:hypothetical protein